ncbi:hypothetical protein P4O66_012946 [Electrophorus voltai]|uniref:Alkylated DNA repair protein AlkB homologue 8 N-terminal domain-containing protein n=1 Tax=Electrophorus voltai TaxID=2609070 RepID=A0AAD8ZV79_9TELE|nr:hypothetical protein P4O66_012946 [Electrophorus voltai]
MHSSNYITKFTDDTTVVGLISEDDESAYREEVRELVSWCKVNNLYLNVDKTKEMVVDFRGARRDHSPLAINGSSVEIIKNTKFFGVHLAENLTWTLNTSSITKRAQQCLYFLWKLREAHLPSPILTTFYRVVYLKFLPRVHEQESESGHQNSQRARVEEAGLKPDQSRLRPQVHNSLRMHRTWPAWICLGGSCYLSSCVHMIRDDRLSGSLLLRACYYDRQDAPESLFKTSRRARRPGANGEAQQHADHRDKEASVNEKVSRRSEEAPPTGQTPPISTACPCRPPAMKFRPLAGDRMSRLQPPLAGRSRGTIRDVCLGGTPLPGAETPGMGRTHHPEFHRPDSPQTPPPPSTQPPCMDHGSVSQEADV